MTVPPPADHVPWYIFGIPPLILVLLPVTSSNCHLRDKGGTTFEHVIVFSIEELEKILDIDSNCLKEHNFFRRHSCADKKEAAFLYRAAHKLKQFVKTPNVTTKLDLHLEILSKSTLKEINCTTDEIAIKESKKNDRCFLKTLIQKIKICWHKILHGH